ncbi:MAG: CorA family divalent cation transporter [Lawsonella clevelandensis]
MGFTSFWDKLFNPQKSAQNEPDDNVHIPTAQATIGCDVYDENGQHIDRTFDYRSGFHWVEEHPGHFVWLQLRDPNRRQMVHVGRVYDLHELLVEDCSTDHQRPKLEAFDDCLTLVARTLRYVDHEVIDNPADAVETGEVVLVAGKNYFISIQHGKGHSLDHVHKRLSHNPEDLAQGPMMCFYRAVDHVVDSYLKVAALMDNDIDDLEEEVFDPSTDIDIDEILCGQTRSARESST